MDSWMARNPRIADPSKARPSVVDHDLWTRGLAEEKLAPAFGWPRLVCVWWRLWAGCRVAVSGWVVEVAAGSPFGVDSGWGNELRLPVGSWSDLPA